jgi:pimeloyl-ACP methyl ester carboxylesterase
MRVVPGAGHWVGFEAPGAVNALLDKMLPPAATKALT